MRHFATKRLKREPSQVRVEDLDAPCVGDFLEHLEGDRGNCARTRNVRLAALRAFFRYVAVYEPAYSLQSQRLLAMPTKRHQRGPVEFLTDEEATALVAAPDPHTWLGRRDRAILLVATQTGLRNAEIRALRCQFEEYRPYKALEQFRREIGKYVDDNVVSRYERYETLDAASSDRDAATE